MIPKDVFSIEQRIYYENTDAGGVVFYGEYLRFLERARTEFMRSHNINIASLTQGDNPLFFVVRHVDITYQKPLSLDQRIYITADIHKKTRHSLTFEQAIFCDTIQTTKAFVQCVSIDKKGKLCPLPLKIP